MVYDELLNSDVTSTKRAEDTTCEHTIIAVDLGVADTDMTLLTF